MTRLPDHEALAFACFLETAPLIRLVNEHSALSARLNLPGAKLWGEQYAEDEANLVAIWRTIGRRFPAYIARQKRLAADRAEHERRIRYEDAEYPAIARKVAR